MKQHRENYPIYLLKNEFQFYNIIKLAGEIESDIMNDTYLIHITNNIVMKDEYVIAKYQYMNGRGIYSEYYENIENGQKVYEFKSDKYESFKVDIVVENMLDYLYKYDMIRDSYNKDDIKKLKDNLLNDPDLGINKSENKQLIK